MNKGQIKRYNFTKLYKQVHFTLKDYNENSQFNKKENNQLNLYFFLTKQCFTHLKYFR